MVKVEALNEQRPFVPIFSSHIIDTRKLWAIREIIDRQGQLPPVWLWPESTLQRVQRLRPGSLALDGLTPSTNINRTLFFTPGNPYDFQPCRIVAVEPPIAEFMQKPVKKASIPELAIRQHWAKVSGGTLEDPNQEHYASRLRTFFKEGVPEVGALILLALGAGQVLGPTAEARLISEVLIYGGPARILANRNLIRHLAPMLDHRTFMIISKLTKPVLFPTGGIGLRNAVAATKLRELPELTTPLPDASETAAVIFGSHHANGVNLWNNPKKQEQVLRQAVEGIFSEAEKLAKLQKLGTYSPLTRDVSRAVNTYLANIATVDYPGTLSDAPTVREINRKAIRKLYVSPTISRIIRETADNS